VDEVFLEGRAAVGCDGILSDEVAFGVVASTIEVEVGGIGDLSMAVVLASGLAAVSCSISSSHEKSSSVPCCEAAVSANVRLAYNVTYLVRRLCAFPLLPRSCVCGRGISARTGRPSDVLVLIISQSRIFGEETHQVPS
jgi:hypothetical protein